MGRHTSALVTGGAGFIGSHLVDALVRAGIRTTVLDDLSGGAPVRLPPGVPLLRHDVADPTIADLVADVAAELVIHAAAQVSVAASMADPVRDRAVNLAGTEGVLEGARRGGARRFVFLSSGGAVYGDTDRVPADEHTPPAPVSPYGRHKLAAEDRVRVSGLPFGILRLSNVYGPRQRAGLEGGVVAVFSQALRAGRPITIHGDGRQTRDLLHVADVVSAALAAADSDLDATWNVSTGVATSINDLRAALERRLGPAVGVRHAPPRPGDVRASTLTPERIGRDLGWRPAFALAAGLDALVGGPRDA